MDDLDTRYVHLPPSWFCVSSHLGSTPVLNSEKSEPDTKRDGVTMLLYRLLNSHSPIFTQTVAVLSLSNPHHSAPPRSLTLFQAPPSNRRQFRHVA